MSVPYGTTVFCDDIRQEVGGKVTLVGCYSVDLITPKLPITIPKLGFHTRVFLPAESAPKTITVKIILPGETAENSFFTAEIPLQDAKLADVPTPEDEPDIDRYLVVATNLAIGPLVLQAGSVRVRAWVNDQMVKVGRLRISEGQYTGPEVPAVPV